jgi:hypothetical protein
MTTDPPPWSALAGRVGMGRELGPDGQGRTKGSFVERMKVFAHGLGAPFGWMMTASHLFSQSGLCLWTSALHLGILLRNPLT